MKTSIFHTVNFGLYLDSGKTGVFIDGIHKGKFVGFSNAPESVINDCRNKSGVFTNLCGLVFSHCHEDHYAGLLVRDIVSKTGIPIFAPQNNDSSIPTFEINDHTTKFTMGDFEFYSFVTIHDGEVYRGEPHRSFIINAPGETLFFAGDAIFYEENADEYLQYAKFQPAAAFVNSYQITLATNRKFIRRLDPQRVILCHGAFEGDFHPRNSEFMAYSISHYPKDMPPLTVSEHMGEVI